MDQIVRNFLNQDVFGRYLPEIVEGMVVTVKLGLAVVVAGLALGLVLALVRTAQVRPVNWLLVFAVDVLRALPPLVIMFVFYFALPYAGVYMSGFVAAWAALSLVLAAFAEEIFWTAILSVHRGQWEAARSTGLSFLQTFRYVVLPQAIRLAIPPLTNRTIAITKGTALASAVGVNEVLAHATAAQAFSANTTPLTMAAIAYVVIFAPLVVASRWVESRFGWKR